MSRPARCGEWYHRQSTRQTRGTFDGNFSCLAQKSLQKMQCNAVQLPVLISSVLSRNCGLNARQNPRPCLIVSPGNLSKAREFSRWMRIEAAGGVKLHLSGVGTKASVALGSSYLESRELACSVKDSRVYPNMPNETCMRLGGPCLKPHQLACRVLQKTGSLSHNSAA